ncbi:hypothetical protein LC605_15895 [Nostoc sp. CHAB 5836]|uniref:hypothetical protein n=1 Tax=Nostoc sp. CHAB 5836 TaxID=2780404 RepID=UPI001E63C040|nr:hypothetical protein [Nostoc sp. CHAB 5836]MCC5616527.1 hypothetical protein [Nostoc sp. CHAB 5836]
MPKKRRIFVEAIAFPLAIAYSFQKLYLLRRSLSYFVDAVNLQSPISNCLTAISSLSTVHKSPGTTEH